MTDIYLTQNKNVNTESDVHLNRYAALCYMEKMHEHSSFVFS